MANGFKGEVSLQHEGEAYEMVLDFNALCDFEGETGKNALTALQGFENGDINASDMRALMWAGLRQKRPDITLREAGEILGSNVGAIEKAAAAAAPEEDTSGNGKRSPSTTKAGTRA